MLESRYINPVGVIFFFFGLHKKEISQPVATREFKVSETLATLAAGKFLLSKLKKTIKIFKNIAENIWNLFIAP